MWSPTRTRQSNLCRHTGCELVQDEAYGDPGRWVEIGIRGTNATLAIKTPDMFDEAEQVL